MICSLCTLFACSTYGQEAKQWQVGARLGWPTGATARYFISDKSAVEAIGGLQSEQISLTALYQLHNDLTTLLSEGWGWYIGAGGHLGTRRIEGNTKFFSGIDAIAGINYSFQNFPMNLSIDWKPAVNINAPSTLADFGISARYIFRKNH
ncbi:hypothetical protein COR50_20855 [Chitinophaga caeni]|uniref:Outer membrane protein beta-barrel domain-containing protein n=2 Tax=Chitinophaga caeni TaxID=2029983 RepID=A0A291QZP6_9BACT|nr:hypothetical protein COR50_20855 [Chitinophaga caeni]